MAEGAALDHEATESYTVTVSVTDGKNADGSAEAVPAVDDTVEVTIDVTDVDEPPARPGAPTVGQSSANPGAPTVEQSSANPYTELDVSWTAPANTGPAITGYTVRYRVQGAKSWTDHAFDGAVPGTTIGGLGPGTVYEVQVRAGNDEGESPWSDAGTGSTAARLSANREVPDVIDVYEPSTGPPPGDPQPSGPRPDDPPADDNDAPDFGGDPGPAEVAESAPAGSPVGGPVAATDPDGDPLTYSISGPNAFDIDPATGQIRVAEGAALDHETTPSYTVTVGVTDGKNADGNAEAVPAVDATAMMTIEVIDVDEPPARPGAPSVSPSSTDPETALDVTWTAPANTGPAITGYDVRYRKEGAEEWMDHAFDGAVPGTTIGGLEPATAYEVQVAAANDEGAGDWSDPGTGGAGAEDLVIAAGVASYWPANALWIFLAVGLVAASSAAIYVIQRRRRGYA